jgi:hypothetical protein
MTQKIFGEEIKIDIKKNAEFHADFESIEKVVKKMHQKKVISKTSLTNMSKSENVSLEFH